MDFDDAGARVMAFMAFTLTAYFMALGAAAFIARRFIAAFFFITFLAGAAFMARRFMAAIFFMAFGAAAFMARRFIAAIFFMAFGAAAFIARRFIAAIFFMTLAAFIAFMALAIAGSNGSRRGMRGGSLD